MKKIEKKLFVQRESVRILVASTLAEVIGGKPRTSNTNCETDCEKTIHC